MPGTECVHLPWCSNKAAPRITWNIIDALNRLGPGGRAATGQEWDYIRELRFSSRFLNDVALRSRPRSRYPPPGRLRAARLRATSTPRLSKSLTQKGRERRGGGRLLYATGFSFIFFPLYGGFRERPDFFLLHALPAADCDTELLLRSSVLSSELSRRSLAYPGPTEMNLAWPVRSPAARQIHGSGTQPSRPRRSQRRSFPLGAFQK